MPNSDPTYNTLPRLATIGIFTPEDVLARALSEKKNLVSVGLVWRTTAQSPSGFSGWELVRPGYITGDPVRDRALNGNRFFHTAEREDAIEYVRTRFGVNRMQAISGFPRCLFPYWVRLRTLAWLRNIPREVEVDSSKLSVLS